MGNCLRFISVREFGYRELEENLDISARIWLLFLISCKVFRVTLGNNKAAVTKKPVVYEFITCARSL